jgi:hypothetical protein
MPEATVFTIVYFSFSVCLSRYVLVKAWDVSATDAVVVV